MFQVLITTVCYQNGKPCACSSTIARFDRLEDAQECTKFYGEIEDWGNGVIVPGTKGIMQYAQLLHKSVYSEDGFGGWTRCEVD